MRVETNSKVSVISQYIDKSENIRDLVNRI